MIQPRSKAWYVAIATAFFLGAQNLNYVIRLLGLQRMLEWAIVLGIRNALEVTVCFVGVAVAHGFGFKRSARELECLRRSGAGSPSP